MLMRALSAFGRRVGIRFRMWLLRAWPVGYHRFHHFYLHVRNRAVPYWLDLRNPKTFNEKIIRLKLDRPYANANQLADKLGVREFVASLVGEQHLVPLIGVFDNVDDINWSALPDKFVAKVTSGSGWNVICRSKASFDVGQGADDLRRWMALSYYDFGGDYSYEGIKPRIVIENLLEEPGQDDLLDFKVFCFAGVPRLIQVDVDRSTNHTRCFFDCEWRRVSFSTLFPTYPGEVPRPSQLSKMLDLASRLSEGFAFVRVDLYQIQDRVYFGELTFHHGGGFEPFVPPSYDRILGDMLALPSASP